MKTLSMQPSRRQFIQQLGLGAAWLGLATNAPLVLANSTHTLPFRQNACLLYTSPSPRDEVLSRMPSSA